MKPVPESAKREHVQSVKRGVQREKIEFETGEWKRIEARRLGTMRAEAVGDRWE